MSTSASEVTGGARATLDAWRERGADRLDPIRFHFIEALDRRAAGHSGEARRLLDERLAKLIEAYAVDLEHAASKAGDADIDTKASSGEAIRGALAGLVDYIASHAPADGNALTAGSVAPRPSSYPELEALDYFRETWSKVRSEKQLRQSLKKAPGNAGPLNSSSLVHRSLSLMSELSPGYLQQFLSYVDALSWMEQMNGGGTLPAKDAPRAASAKKNTRGKSR
ncbi:MULTISPECIES: DUF2894 domain-containing protein [Paraburkholderia]|uniref:DUF2894 domain-containing protein n=1 Tax=Paraburkholderia madseniana TaxID=2599607 RepID=A0AAP5BLH3_9BURK|nr:MULTISPECIES: DUF2894 domain-containing protein [Paraburkholderia]MCX4150952.1 DUF2894 domain-containing protein [Paraburkholderia madseniana]MDN7153885.1 DUF2894 domain-containing protein [Paraburkholderia sp. WS6]MDQ6412767.1 DUF2894 domain-containing protein [Paraburkholderia madseniana]